MGSQDELVCGCRLLPRGPWRARGGCAGNRGWCIKGSLGGGWGRAGHVAAPRRKERGGLRDGVCDTGFAGRFCGEALLWVVVRAWLAPAPLSLAVDHGRASLPSSSQKLGRAGSAGVVEMVLGWGGLPLSLGGVGDGKVPLPAQTRLAVGGGAVVRCPGTWSWSGSCLSLGAWGQGGGDTPALPKGRC